LGGKTGSGQNPPASAAGDPFIGAIETMKQSVARLACIAANGDESRTLDRPGSAFFLSRAGDFLTAAHVILDMQQRERTCPISAISIPVENWDPDARNEPQVWFPFRIPDCNFDRELDVAACKPVDDLSVPRPRMAFKITPVKFEWSNPPDGAYVVFTGFPLRAREPMTSRGAVAARRTIWREEKALPELVLDRAAWPGSSGSPVYLIDGSVIDGSVVGILLKGGMEEATGTTLVRPASVIREFLVEKTKN
jgi:hypothetical protein